MRRFKLANVLLGLEDFLAEIPEVLYQVEDGSSCEYDDRSGELAVSGLVDFCTYFNGASVAKWRRYTVAKRIFLHLELAGDACTVALRTLDAPDASSPALSEVVEALEVEPAASFREIELEMPEDVVIAGFALMTAGTVKVRNAYYYTEVDEESVRDIRVAVCTTTFQKEEFIVPNIARIRKGVLESADEIADRFHMFVVDNGRTLDAAGLSGGGVTVIPNPNAGGAGGFARGMMEALDAPDGFTHVILMDDDVRMSVESFHRTFALLSLACEEYALACLNGAMLELERPWLQYEDVAFAREMGGYDRLKHDYRITNQTEIVQNELFDVEVPHAYGAWWYSCVPLALVREKGLPMPFFVRCDDAEFGVRLGAKYMTMNGICVWHARFDTRFNAAVDLYQYARNVMAMMALHDDFFDQDKFMMLYWRIFHFRMRKMEYDAIELWLDGLEDYLKGPEFLMEVDGAALLKQNNERKERLVPVDELDPAIMAELEYDPAWLSRPEDPVRDNALANAAFHVSDRAKKLFMTIPYDRHLLPDFMLSPKPGVVTGVDSFSPWWTIVARSNLVVLNSDATMGHVRTLDRERYKQLTERFKDLMKRYREEGAAIAARWREKMPEMTSEEFWRAYLERLS